MEKIDGDIGFSEAGVGSLGELREVTGNFWMSNVHVYSHLRSLGALENVGGDLSLRYSNVTDLGRLTRVGGKLNLRDTKVTNLGVLRHVGGDLYLPKSLESRLDFSGVTVGGKIKYWNDKKDKKEPKSKEELGLARADRPVPYWPHAYVFSSADLQAATPEQRAFYAYFKDAFLNGVFINSEGNSNYEFVLMYDLLDDYRRHRQYDRLREQLEELAHHYPKTGHYAGGILLDVLHEERKYESAWEAKRAKGGAMRPTEIYEYELKLGRRVLDGALMAALAGHSHLTEFGQNNIEEIAPLAERWLDDFEREKGIRFFEAFFKANPSPRRKEDAFLAYDQGHYRQFYVSESEFDFYKTIDDAQAKSGYSRGVTHVAEKAVLSQFRLFLKRAEDSYRESIGMPKVGEGWISETELYYKIATAFPQYEVVHHGRPPWLGNQHLDVYMPELNVGVEYQGAQHYRAVEFFGGAEAFEKNVERDQRKRLKCEENGCTLIYVDEGYVFDDVRSAIENAIKP